MPIPKPNKGEKQNDFIGRCMGNDTMKTEFPDQKQRNAVCFKQWRDSKENLRRDEDGHIIVAENVKLVFNGNIDFKEEVKEDGGPSDKTNE